MASPPAEHRPAHRPARRPRLAAARRFITRLLPSALRRRAAVPAGPDASAGIADGLRVRFPLTMLRWYRAFRQPSLAPGAGSSALSGRQSALSGHPTAATAATAAPGRPPAMTSVARRPLGPSRPALGQSRSPLTAARRAPLVAAPAAGPDVQPGHALPMAGVSPAGFPAAFSAADSSAGFSANGSSSGFSAGGSSGGVSPAPRAGTDVVARVPGIGTLGQSPPLTAAIGRRDHADRGRQRPPASLLADSASLLAGAAAAPPLATRPAAGPEVSNPDAVSGLRVLGAATLPPGNVPDPTGAVSVSPAVAAARPPVARDRELTPRQRWDAAVAARPLEKPQTLPSALHAMATAITGRARPPMFTTGPNTRAALAAAGALGATTGTTVHLPGVPTSAPAVSAVLAHELAHTRSPVSRPRFLLGIGTGLLDDDERQALSAGQQAKEAGAGIVDSLPVGGMGGALGNVSETATRAARAAIIEATSGGAMPSMPGMPSMGGLPGMSDLSGAAGQAENAAGSALQGLEQAGSQAVSQAGGALAGAAGGLAGAAAGVAGAAAGLDPDKIVEIVEQRLLREIERRGGRWAGVF